jgi:selenium metabolism protein YedF
VSVREIDVRSLACPGPVLKLRELLDAGERQIRFHVADQLSRSNVTRFAASRGAQVAVTVPGDGSFLLTITAGAGAARARADEAAVLACEPVADPTGATGARRPQVVQVTGAPTGAGADDLGAPLPRSFLKPPAQLEHRPDSIVFYNRGVSLCCEGSPLLDDLRALEEAGVEIIACGTCLNYFNLADRLAVGRVTDMLEIAGRLAGAGSIVRP